MELSFEQAQNIQSIIDYPLETNTGMVDDLTAQQKQFLEDNGYVVIENVIDPQQCSNSIQAICDFLEVSLSDPSTWYKDKPLNSIGLVPLHQHPAFWDVRQNPKLYSAFSRLLDETNLWVTMDRASFRPPCRYDLPTYGNDENPIHWDYDFRKKSQSLYQGLIYLSDTNKQQGAFSCVPSVYQQIKAGTFEHMDSLDQFHSKGLFLKDVMPFSKDDIVAVDAPAGSLIVWDARLPHGCVSNHYHQPRFVQFVSMFKAEDQESVPVEIIQDRHERVECFQTMRAPECHRNLRGQVDPEPYDQPKLTALGRKLVGINSW
ncbi:phytanoyl-CoA dioxygenase family protein [Vibrio mexicanus]|uniref:phytanoyl-CoA dioxygenase family protein n=1 Tax=Vibrio mexicanus TaxID=1004326 RepID=UPI000A428AD8|nr:phytanoyl-CoA dioxygenase family protein [Vibrio mexicanus]